MTQNQRVDATSAEDKSVGFDYQYFFFINQLLNLKTGMSVGLEVMDDVHTELNNDTQVLVQLKHTVQTKADGQPKNLTTMDTDLWKSLSNWCKVIVDPDANRSATSSQLAFVKRTYFLLTSNKSENEGNLFLQATKDYHSKKISHRDLLEKVKNFRDSTENNDLKSYMGDIIDLNTEVSEIFLKHLRFDLGHDDIIEKCKTTIREHHIDDSRVDDVFRAIDSDIRTENYDLVKSRKKIIYTFDEFRKKFRSHFDKARNEKLVIRKFDILLPPNIDDQIFIQQLMDIGDFDQDDISEITRLTVQLLTARNNIDQWVKDSDITNSELKDLETDLISAWKNKFKKAYRRTIIHEEIEPTALEIVDELRERLLTIQEQSLGTEISNGILYDLSDRPKIGWLKTWKEKYK